MNSSTARNFRTYAAGFTLVELAMVLVILALLGGSLLVPLASRQPAQSQCRWQQVGQVNDGIFVHGNHSSI